MAYDEQLAARIRSVLADTNGVSERKMFGGLAVLVGGNMACGVVGDKLMLRLGREGAEGPCAGRLSARWTSRAGR